MNKTEFESRFSGVKCVAFDLDGTVYLGNKVILGIMEMLEALRNSGRKVVFLTNNSSKTERFYAHKLEAMGLFKKGDSIVTSGDACVRYLKSERKSDTVQLLGTKMLREDFVRQGIKLVDENASVCVLSYDTELDYERLCKFCINTKDAYYIATHPDDVCPSERGDLPDVGSFIELIAKATKRKPDLIIGKPYTNLGEYLMEKEGLNKEQIMMVGDRLYTDIRFARNCGFLSLLVLSGETTQDMAKTTLDTPDYILNSANELKNFI